MKMCGSNKIGLTLFALLVLSKEVDCYAKFGSLTCKIYDPSIGYFKFCGIKAISHTSNVLSLHLVLEKTMDKFYINWQILKRNSLNIWHPFLYNVTLAACDFIKHPNRYPIAAIGWQYGKRYTNINHTCPFNAGEEIILKEIPFDLDWILQRIPLDVGDYAIHSNYYMRKQLIGSINASVSYSDYKKN